jgi:hypothetical protein
VHLLDVVAALEPVLRRQGRLIALPGDRRIVYVGDTHGDADAVRRVLARYAEDGAVVVFLGDAVDRGPDSADALRLILDAKRCAPEGVYLLMGNHEAWAVAPFAPADFWLGLAEDEARALGTHLLQLPFAAWHPRGALALHGALPDVDAIEDIAEIRPGSANWRRITWGDWRTEGGPPEETIAGRPSFGPDTFFALRTRLGFNVLIRSHQPTAPLRLFEDRCLTLFTSDAYGDGPRRVAILEAAADAGSIDDLQLETV